MDSKKFQGYLISTFIGTLAFLILAFRMLPEDLMTLCQFFFFYQGAITAGFLGFRFGEQFSFNKFVASNGVKKEEKLSGKKM